MPAEQKISPATRQRAIRGIAAILKVEPSATATRIQALLAEAGIKEGQYKISRGNIRELKKELRGVSPAKATSGSTSSSRPATRPSTKAKTSASSKKRRTNKVSKPSGGATQPKPYKWQVDALAKWKAAKHVGVVQAITGAGKSRVGLEAAISVTKAGGAATLLVPSLVLADQWQHDAAAHVAIATWPTPGALSIHTMAAACKDDFPWPDLEKGRKDLLIVDEVHRIGSEIWPKGLWAGASHRLGLTATLERSDSGLEDHVIPYFNLSAGKNGLVPTFDLGYKRARSEGAISEFQVIFAPAHLSPKESKDHAQSLKSYSDSWKTLHSRTSGRGKPSLGDTATNKLKWAARFNNDQDREIRGAARMVIKSFNALGTLMSEMVSKLGLVSELAKSGALKGRKTILSTQREKTMTKVTQSLRDARVNAVEVSAETDEDDRKARVREFRDGKADAFSSPRVGDEGINFPEADLAISIATVKSRRQLVQRLGRIIRPVPGKLATFVVLYAVGTLEDPAKGGAKEFRELVKPGAKKLTDLPPSLKGPKEIAAAIKKLLPKAVDRGAKSNDRN
jgi:RNA polymerase primary sigma factor